MLINHIFLAALILPATHATENFTDTVEHNSYYDTGPCYDEMMAAYPCFESNCMDCFDSNDDNNDYYNGAVRRLAVIRDGSFRRSLDDHPSAQDICMSDDFVEFLAEVEYVKGCCPACLDQIEVIASCLNDYCENVTSAPSDAPTVSMLPTSSVSPTDSSTSEPTRDTANCLPITIKVQTDSYGEESSFDLRNSETNAILWNETFFEANTNYTFTPCIENVNTTCLTFNFYDSYGDGMFNYYEVWYDETLVAEGGNQRGSNAFRTETSKRFGHCPATETPAKTPTTTPTKSPTMSPTTTESGFSLKWDSQSWNDNAAGWTFVDSSDEITTLPSENSEMFLNFKWKDQGWGNKKGRFRIRLWNEENEETKATYFIGVAPHTWEDIDEIIGNDSLMISNAEIGDIYIIEIYVGNGGGHVLYIDDFNLRIPFAGGTLHSLFPSEGYPTNIPTNTPSLSPTSACADPIITTTSSTTTDTDTITDTSDDTTTTTTITTTIITTTTTTTSG